MNNLEELKDWQKKYGFRKAEQKLSVVYSGKAYSKTRDLIANCPLEIGWNMVVKNSDEGFVVEDIVVYPQRVTPSYISVDVDHYGLWKATLDDDTDMHLFGHGHSHVDMATFPSVVDEKQQRDEIMMKKKGFYLFQIWNKRGDINSFFYDLDRKLYYESEDINLKIIVSNEKQNAFVAEAMRNVNTGRRNTSYEAGEKV